MTFFTSEPLGSSIHSFFARSIVETLHVECISEPESWFSSILGPLNHLKTLLLSYCSFLAEDLDEFLSNQSNIDSIPWPRLTTLYLSDCQVLTGPACKLLSRHPIQTLRIQDCSILDPDAPAQSDTEEGDLWLRAQLSAVVPDTELSGIPFDLFEHTLSY